MVTGLRRAELLALRWTDVELDTGYLTISRNYLRLKERTVEKYTKTHQLRRISLDEATVEVLAEHNARYLDTMRTLDTAPRADA